jgi:hypothetical protein
MISLKRFEELGAQLSFLGAFSLRICIVTIGETPGFAEECGIINFYLKSGKFRFEINIEASHRENLQISSKLLRLARIVNSQCD